MPEFSRALREAQAAAGGRHYMGRDRLTGPSGWVCPTCETEQVGQLVEGCQNPACLTHHEPPPAPGLPLGPARCLDGEPTMVAYPVQPTTLAGRLLTKQYDEDRLVARIEALLASRSGYTVSQRYALAQGLDLLLQLLEGDDLSTVDPRLPTRTDLLRLLDTLTDSTEAPDVQQPGDADDAPTPPGHDQLLDPDHRRDGLGEVDPPRDGE